MSSDIINISEENCSPLVKALLCKLEARDALIDGLYQQVSNLKEDNQLLKDEIARLKKAPQRPNLRAKNNGKKKKPKKDNDAKRPGSAKKSKKCQLRVDETKIITPPNLPEGAKLKRTRNVILQDLILKSLVTKYVLEEWVLPNGKSVSAQLPANISRSSFGNELCRFILYQYHHCQVTEPLIKEQLNELGIDISKGQINSVINEKIEIFHKEKQSILKTGLAISEWIQTDDTSAPHSGKNGFCTHIGNEYFAYYSSSGSKSRRNFLEILNSALDGKYRLDKFAFRYMQEQNLPSEPLNKLKGSLFTGFKSEKEWMDWLKRLGIVKKNHIRIASEAALLSGAIFAGLPKDLAILSDDAGQFNIPLLRHALCWIHEGRHIKKLIPESTKGKRLQNEMLEKFWNYYDRLIEFKDTKDPSKIKELKKDFDSTFRGAVEYEGLNAVRKRILAKKDELLVVLKCPSLPLHNNGSENDIREFVKRRKVSGGTRSSAGRTGRDTFASLKKTCRKLGVSFWQYLGDRLAKIGQIEKLSKLMELKAAEDKSNIKQTQLHLICG